MEVSLGILSWTISYEFLAKALSKYLKRRRILKGKPDLESVVSYYIKSNALDLSKTRTDDLQLRLIIDKSDEVAVRFISEITKFAPKTVTDLNEILHKSILDVGIPVSRSDSDELLRLVAHSLLNGVTRDAALFKEITAREIKKAKVDPATADRIQESIGVLERNAGKRTKLNIDRLAGSYAKRVFVGGAYDDLPTLRQIANYVKECGFHPVIAIDYVREMSMDVHDFDLLLLHNCKFAIFELSLAAGHYTEAEWAIRMLEKRTLGLCKARDGEPREHALGKVSTMITAVFEESKQPILVYSNFQELRRLVRSTLSSWRKTT